MKNTPRQVGFGTLKRKDMDLSNTFAASARIQSINHRVTKMKNKKIKPIFKSTTYNQNLISWIIEEFPENYTDLIYIDLFCDNIGVYLQKSKSKIEIINDSHEGIIQIYRAIKDEYKHFVKKINAVKCNSETFEKFIASEGQKYEDYIEKAVNEFVLRKLSKAEGKKSFIDKKIKWDEIIDESLAIRNRLQETFIMNKEAIEVIQKFNNHESFIYCDLPIDLREQQYTKITNLLNNFSGKVLITSKDQKICKKYFVSWTCKRKMLQKNTKKKLECIWKNY